MHEGAAHAQQAVDAGRFEVVAVGGDPSTWFVRALATPGDAFGHAVDRLLERQPWVTLRLKLPADVRDLFRDACQRALPYVLQDPADLSGWDDPRNLVKVVELLAGKFLRDVPIMDVGAEGMEGL